MLSHERDQYTCPHIAITIAINITITIIITITIAITITITIAITITITITITIIVRVHLDFSVSDYFRYRFFLDLVSFPSPLDTLNIIVDTNKGFHRLPEAS